MKKTIEVMSIDDWNAEMGYEPGDMDLDENDPTELVFASFDDECPYSGIKTKSGKYGLLGVEIDQFCSCEKMIQVLTEKY